MQEKNSRTKMTRAAAATFPVRHFRLWNDRDDNREARIEIVPLMDVIFCILIFFILAAVGFSRQQAINVELPKAKSGTPQMREMLVVSLDDFEQIYVEQQPVTKNQLMQALRNYHQFNPNGMMVLYALPDTKYDAVIQVLDMLKEVGGDRVALATLEGESNALQNSLMPNNDNSAFPSGTNVPGGNYNYSLPQQNQTVPGTPNNGQGNSQLNAQPQYNPYNPNQTGVPNAPATTPNNSTLPGSN